MSKKDYQLLAEALLRSKMTGPSTEEGQRMWRHTVVKLADALDNENPRFARGRFFKACGLEGYQGASNVE